jgi:hypothetical protein
MVAAKEDPVVKVGVAEVEPAEDVMALAPGKCFICRMFIAQGPPAGSAKR